MDYNSEEVRRYLSGSIGLELVNGCNDGSAYNETVTLLTNALIKEDETSNEVRNGLAENICRLIIRQSNLAPNSSPTADDLHKANDLMEVVASMIQSSIEQPTSEFIECLLNIARKPNMANNYCLYIPALTIIYNTMMKNKDLGSSRISATSFAEENWHLNVINLIPKRLFALPTGCRPTSIESIQLFYNLLSQLKEADFHTGFGKVIPLQIQRFTNDTFSTLCHLCYALRNDDPSSAANIVKAIQFHYKAGMNLSKHIMKHFSTASSSAAAVKLCNEFIYLNPSCTVALVLDDLSKVIKASDGGSDVFCQSLRDLAVAINNDDKAVLPSDVLEEKVKILIKDIQSLSGAEDAVQAWEQLIGTSAAISTAAAIGTAAAVASKPGVVSSSYDSKIQQKIATSDTKPGVYAAAASSAESRKIQIDQGSRPGSAVAEANNSNIARKIATSDTPGVMMEASNNNMNRKIQMDEKIPGVSSQTSDNAINRKIQIGAAAAASRPGSVVTEADNAVQRKIQTNSEASGPIVESRYDDAINRKIQTNDNNASITQPSVMVQSNQYDNSVNKKIAQNNTPVYQSNEPMKKDNVFAVSDKDNLDLSNNPKILIANEDIGHNNKSKENTKLIEETQQFDILCNEHDPYQNSEMEQIANAQEFRHQVNRNRKDKHKKKREKKQMKQSGWDSEQNLAVAVAIEEDEDDQYFNDYDPIFAEEYDPDYKPKMYKNPRVMSRIICCFVIILACVTGVIVTFTKEAVYEPEPTLSPTLSPTAAPTSYRDTLGIDEYISSYFGYNFTSSLDDTYDISPYEYNRRLAINWIVNVDPLTLNIDDNYNAILQRYIVILIYLSTNGDHWRACNGDDGYDNDYDTNMTTYYYDDGYYNDNDIDDGEGEQERTVDRQLERWMSQQERLHQQTNDVLTMECEYTDWLGYTYNDTRWLSRVNECEWFGIMCNKDKEVQQLLLHDNDLQGTIPWEISKLPYLYRFWVNANSINGQIPEEIGTMSHLADLQLHANMMTGTIPDSLFDVSTLQAVNLAMNYFTGTISPKYSQLTNLKGVHLFTNHFTGSIPDSIGDLSYLAYAWLHDNVIDGQIPESILKLEKLLQLSLSNNVMHGKIPKEIGNAKNLEALLLENNKFTGTIPQELYSLTNLKNLFLQTNDFSGTISEDISNLTRAEKLIFRENNFKGTIPTTLGKLENLDNLWFHFNKFEGEVPKEICDLFEKRKEYCDFIEKEEIGACALYADCDDTMGNAAIECDCCTDCCDNVQHVCYEQ